MCKQVILAQSNTAIISHSPGCGCIHLTLPNITIKLALEGLLEFNDYISSLIYEQRITNDKYFVETPYQGIILYFSAEEMESLSKVLLRSILRMEVGNLEFSAAPSKN